MLFSRGFVFPVRECFRICPLHNLVIPSRLDCFTASGRPAQKNVPREVSSESFSGRADEKVGKSRVLPRWPSQKVGHEGSAGLSSFLLVQKIKVLLRMIPGVDFVVVILVGTTASRNPCKQFVSFSVSLAYNKEKESCKKENKCSRVE